MDSNRNGNFNEAYEPPPYRAPETGLETERQKNQWTPGNEQAEFDAAVQSVTKWDTYNFQGAYDEAARTGKGVTFIVGSSKTDDMQKTLENIKAVQAANPGMQVVFLDTDKIAADPRLAEVQGWVDRNVKHDRTLMAQYAVRPGENGKPEGGQLISKNWGSDMRSWSSTIPLGDQMTAQHQGKFVIPDRSAELPGGMPADMSPQVQPLDVERQHQALQEKLKQARDAKKLEDYYGHYKAPRSRDGKVPGGAIAQADSIDQKAVSEELTKVSSDIDAASKAVAAAEGQSEEVRVKAQQQLEALRERRNQLEFLRDAPAQTRAECAQRLLAGGREIAADKDGDQKRATEMQLAGHYMVNEAVALNPGSFRSEEGKEQLRAMGYNDAAIARMTADPTSEPSKTQIADNLFGMTEQEKEELEKSGMEDQLLEKQREVLDAAIKEAIARNVPLVIKFGLKGCEGCDFMDGNTMQPLAAEFKENAVFASMHGFAAKQALLERGYNVEGMSFPGMQVFAVSKAGNLTREAKFETDQIVNMNNTDFAKDPARASLAPVLQMLRTEREREQNFEAVRQVQAQYEEQLRQREEQNRQRAQQQQRERELRDAALMQKRRDEQDHLQGLGFPMNNFVLVA